MTNLFIAHLEAKGSSPHTIAAYSHDLTEFFNALPLLSEQRKPIEQWARSLQGAPATINRKIQAVRSYYKWAKETRRMDRDPSKDLKNKKLPKRLPKFKLDLHIPAGLTKEQFAALSLLKETGIRLAELTDLKANDVTDREIKVTGKGNKQRIIPISRNMAALLSELKAQAMLSELKAQAMLSEQTLLFGLKRHQVQYLSRKYLGCNPHTLRHSFATTLINAGAPLLSIKELLGHSQITTTQVYTSLDFNRLKEIHAKCHPKA